MEFLLFLVLILIGAVGFIFYLENRRGRTITRSFPDGKSATGRFIFDSLVARAVLRKNYIAVAIGSFVFVKGPRLPDNTITHELRHVYQWKEFGFFRFIWEYLKEHRRHGYSCNRFEEDARIAAGEPTRCR